MSSETPSWSISCVIPTHRRAQFLPEALESVKSQTLSPIEIIVVSDVQDEATAEVCAAFAEKSSIPVIVEFCASGPGGASFSRNRGVELASGRVVAFLDDDDTWNPAFLEKTLEVLEGQDVGLAAAWISMFMGTQFKAGPAIRSGLNASDVAAVNPGVTGSNMLIRREAFDALGGFDPELRMKNDTDFFFRFLKADGQYGVVEEHLVNQRKHSSGQLTGHSLARADHTEAYMRKHWDELSRSDRRHLRFVIHRIRSNAARTRLQRLTHKAAALMNYSRRQFLDDRNNRKDRQFFDIPSISPERDGA